MATNDKYLRDGTKVVLQFFSKNVIEIAIKFTEVKSTSYANMRILFSQSLRLFQHNFSDFV